MGTYRDGIVDRSFFVSSTPKAKMIQPKTCAVSFTTFGVGIIMLQLHNAILLGYAKFCSRSHDTLIRVYDEAGNVIEAHEGWTDSCGKKEAIPTYESTLGSKAESDSEEVGRRHRRFLRTSTRFALSRIIAALI
jgi:hypothetical protein